METVAEKFWRESREQRERREEIEAMSGMDRFNAILKDVWAVPQLEEPVIRWGKAQELDEWLAEDNPHRLTHYGVASGLEALGVR